MQAIVPNRPAQLRPYAWGSVVVDPNPPRVGQKTRIVFPLTNPGPDEVVVERVDVGIAMFGMGMPWEQLDPVGPIVLPPAAGHVKEVGVEWTPRQGGHRCVRAHIHVRGLATPVLVGKNLDVLHASADESSWRVPFHIGNPDHRPAPIVLRLDGSEDPDLRATIHWEGKEVEFGRRMWLRPGEVATVELRLFTPAGPPINAVRTIEAFIGARFIDGILIAVHRPALLRATSPTHLMPTSRRVAARDLAGVR